MSVLLSMAANPPIVTQCYVCGEYREITRIPVIVGIHTVAAHSVQRVVQFVARVTYGPAYRARNQRLHWVRDNSKN